MAAITTIYPVPAGPAGAAGLVYRGVYDAGTAYAKSDVVRVGNQQWIALTAVPAGNDPAENAYWTIFFDGDAAQDAAQGYADASAASASAAATSETNAAGSAAAA